jgi:hypothetical protein
MSDGERRGKEGNLFISKIFRATGLTKPPHMGNGTPRGAAN